MVKVVTQIRDIQLQAEMKHLVLGGARSGKSAFAESMLLDWQKISGGRVVYIATSNHRNDAEMLKRVEHHKSYRPVDWETIEEPIYLAEALKSVCVDLSQEQMIHNESILDAPVAVIVDCLTLWMLNIIEADCRKQQTEQLLQTLKHLRCPVVLVSNEVGLGVVPMGKLSREFVDEIGRLHQAIAAQVEAVTFVTAGLPMSLKSPLK